jgi:hypothetical protein
MKKSEDELERDIAAYLAGDEPARRPNVNRPLRGADASHGEGPASGTLVRFQPCFKPCSQEQFDEKFEVLPPIGVSRKGFLVSEPWSHRVCNVTGRYSPTYPALVKRGAEYFESCEGITVAEWRALDPGTLQIV